MWSTEYTAETELAQARVWAALRALHEGRFTYEGGDEYVLHGPFAVGTRLSVTPDGQDTFDSTIVELVEGSSYADETIYGDLTLRFRHLLEPVGAGTRVTHRLEIDGEPADEVGPELGPQIAGDFPELMQQLFAAASSDDAWDPEDADA
ncbi:SRPBCC family protein [Rathayibacter sp. CAU 1779]